MPLMPVLANVRVNAKVKIKYIGFKVMIDLSTSV